MSKFTQESEPSLAFASSRPPAYPHSHGDFSCFTMVENLDDILVDNLQTIFHYKFTRNFPL